MDFHFSLLRCLDDVDDNDGCTTEKKRRGWERQRVICVPSWVWYVYGFVATMLVCGLCMSFWPPWIIKFGFGFRALFRWLGGFYGSGFLTAKELGTVWFVMESDGFAATMSLG